MKSKSWALCAAMLVAMAGFAIAAESAPASKESRVPIDGPLITKYFKKTRFITDHRNVFVVREDGKKIMLNSAERPQEHETSRDTSSDRISFSELFREQGWKIVHSEDAADVVDIYFTLISDGYPQSDRKNWKLIVSRKEGFWTVHPDYVGPNDADIILEPDFEIQIDSQSYFNGLYRIPRAGTGLSDKDDYL